MKYCIILCNYLIKYCGRMWKKYSENTFSTHVQNLITGKQVIWYFTVLINLGYIVWRDELLLHLSTTELRWQHLCFQHTIKQALTCAETAALFIVGLAKDADIRLKWELPVMEHLLWMSDKNSMDVWEFLFIVSSTIWNKRYFEQWYFNYKTGYNSYNQYFMNKTGCMVNWFEWIVN